MRISPRRTLTYLLLLLFVAICFFYFTRDEAASLPIRHMIRRERTRASNGFYENRQREEFHGNPLPRIRQELAAPNPDVYPAAELTPAKTDIQMKDLYDVLAFDNVNGGAWKQGWDITYNVSQWTPEQPLQIFIVPHSHNDPGWLRTFQEYFEDHTKQIFDLMVQKLPVNPNRKFIWAEVSYLALWWATAPKNSQNVFKKLVKDGQVELVTGGWVMTDEANSHYSAMINQLVEGHEWIRNHIGPDAIPRHGWSIDPFGLSSTMAYILKLNNFDAMLIQRAHYSVKKHLAKIKALEFQWRQTWDGSKSGKTDILCHMMPFYFYDIPHTCGPDPKVCCQFDFRRLPETDTKVARCPWGVQPRAITPENVKERAEALLDQYRKKAQLTKTNVVLIPVGDDFRYDIAKEWDQQFENYEAIISHLSSKDYLNVRIQFGTLKDYFDAVKLDIGNRSLTLPSLSGDFFTYADRDEHYWSGYFTSRPFYKSLERRLEARLRSAEIAFSMALARSQREPNGPLLERVDSLFKQLVLSRRSLALFQHHDGITGTAKNHVVVDYAIKMITALTSCDDVLAASLSFLLFLHTTSLTPATDLESDERFVTHDWPPVKSRLHILQNGRRVVVYNSLGQSRKERVTLRIDSPKVVVVEEKSGKTVLSQINPVWVGVGKSKEISRKEFELVFMGVVPALGIKTFLINTLPYGEENDTGPVMIEMHADSAEMLYSAEPGNPFVVKTSKYPVEIELENQHYQIVFDGTTGYLKQATDKQTEKRLDVGLKFIQYGTTNRHEKSGAYLFLPDGPAKDALLDLAPLIRVIRGPVVSELHLVTDQFLHIVRVTHSLGLEGQALEIINHVDITHTSNYELAMHLTTGIRSDNNFVTDLNGFQLIQRKTLMKLPLQGNYYPMPSVAFLEDDEWRLTLVGQQPLGAASLKEGCLEVMQDRRLDQDDNRGLGQPVHDNVPMTRSAFRLIVETNRPPGGVTYRKPETLPVLTLLSHLSLQSLLNPFIVMLDSSSADSAPQGEPDFPGMPQDMPCDVHLLNMRTSVAKEIDESVVTPFSGSSADNATALMMLHRVGVDYRREATLNLKCQSLKSKLDLRASLQSVFSLTHVEEGSLSPLSRGKLIPVDGMVTLNSMHVHAFSFLLL